MFPASGVRPNSSVPEEFQTLPRFRSADDSRTRPVAVASAEQTVWSSQFQFHGLCLCASPVVSQRSTSGMQTLLSTWTFQQRLTIDSCHRECCARAVQRGDSVFLAGRVLRDKISTPTGMGDVAHSRGSNIDDLGFTWTRYNFDVRSLGEPAQKS